MVGLSLKNISLSFQKKNVFSHLAMDIKPNQWTCLLGKSGIGKSSLIKIIAGILPYQMGEIITTNQIPPQQQIAYLGQSDLLLPWLNIMDNILLEKRLTGFKIKKKDIINAKNYLEKAELSGVHHLFPHQLSGGMRQRVAMIRTLLQNKPIVLLDEPFSSLDIVTRYKLHKLAVEIFENKTVFFITHDPYEAVRLAHSIFLMDKRAEPISFILSLHGSTPRDLDNPKIHDIANNLLSYLIKSSDNVLHNH